MTRPQRVAFLRQMLSWLPRVNLLREDATSQPIELHQPRTEPIDQKELSERASQLREAADKAADHVGKVYLTFVLLGTYIAVIIGSTTDDQLLRISPVTLPILDVKLPIVAFYAFVPWLLVLLHFNLLLQSYLLASKVHRFATAVKILGDRERAKDHYLLLSTFPLSQLLMPRHYGWFTHSLIGAVIWITFLILPMLLLLAAQVRFMPYHSETIIFWQRLAIMADLALVWILWPMIVSPHDTLQTWWADFSWRSSRVLSRVAFAMLSLGVLTFSVFVAVLPQEPVWYVLEAFLTDVEGPGKVLTVTYELFDKEDSILHRSLDLHGLRLVQGEPSHEIVASLVGSDMKDREAALKKVLGLSLANRDLRRANFKNAVLPKADFRGAKLENAVFSKAQLQGSDFTEAELREADFSKAGLQDVTFPKKLHGIDFSEVELQGANFSMKELNGARFLAAKLQGADFSDTELVGAEFQSAELQGATFRRADLRGADFSSARLQGVDLQSSLISGADFGYANLILADFSEANSGPMDMQFYDYVKKTITDAVSNDSRQKKILLNLKAATEVYSIRKTFMHGVDSDLLCVEAIQLPFCAKSTPNQKRVKLRKLNDFLALLACSHERIAIIFAHRARDMPSALLARLLHPKCEGGAKLPEEDKAYLRKWTIR